MNPLRTLAALVIVCLLTLSIQASSLHDRASANIVDTHRRLVQRRASIDTPARVRRSNSTRCKVRSTSASWSTATSTTWSSQWTSSTTDTPQSTSTAWTSSSWTKTSSSSSKPSSTSSSAVVKTNTVTGLINVVSSCGNIGASKKVTATSGPNGNIDWLNCGINSGGWQPPNIQVSDLITVDLSWAVQQNGSPFTACSSYIYLFEQYGNQYGIPPIMLAAFAMQESSCNPDTVGAAGEQGLMQITKDKCGGAPNGNCKEPDFNVRTGANFFSESLAANNNNVLLTIGAYNGWYTGLTYGAATAAAYTSCCRCQNNLDYLHQFVNGWLQNIDSYTNNPALGKYFNLNQCS